MEPSFVLMVHQCVTPNTARHVPHINFQLRMRTFLQDATDGGLREHYSRGDLQESPILLPESLFGSDRHRYFVALSLRVFGWHDQDSLQLRLDHAFAHSNLILEKEKRDQSNNEFGNTVTIIFRVKKFFLRDYDDVLEARAMELSMREGPKVVPATKESVQALPKVKLEDDDNGIECIICMEKLVEVGTRMPCSHLFHGDCIEKWLNINHLCPLCRFLMPTEAGN